MVEKLKLVTLHARTAFEAQVLATVLKSAGIKVFESQDLRSDEFAMSQELLNLTGTEVLVLAAQLEAAKRAIAQAREDKKLPEGMLDESVQEPPGAAGAVQ